MSTRLLRGFALAFCISLVLAACKVAGPRSEGEIERPARMPPAAASPQREGIDPDRPNEPRDLRAGTAEGRDALRAAPGALTAQPEPVWYGLLHAHTFFSDGSGTPKEAFARAKEKGVDFLAVTEHNHEEAEFSADDRVDGVLIATTPALYASDQPVTVTRRPKGAPPQTVTVDSLLKAAKDATSTDFAALYGQEFSTISAGNHINVLRWDEVIEIEKGEFRQLYELIDEKVAQGAAVPVLQMNHPDVSEDLHRPNTPVKRKQNDYGFDDYGKDFAMLVAASDKYIALIEVLTGPATKRESFPVFHYSHVHETDYYYYLSQGFHLSPSVGHDNHYHTWGDSTPARMGVYAQRPHADDLYAAMRANRTFATEDSDLVVQFTINGKAMGSVLSSVPAGEPLRFTLTIEDPTDAQAEYEATLVRGFVEPQRADTLFRLDVDDGEVETYLVDQSPVELDTLKAGGGPEFYYVRITQQTDGDRAWTAPIWINHPRNRP